MSKYINKITSTSDDEFYIRDNRLGEGNTEYSIPFNSPSGQPANYAGCLGWRWQSCTRTVDEETGLATFTFTLPDSDPGYQVKNYNLITSGDSLSCKANYSWNYMSEYIEQCNIFANVLQILIYSEYVPDDFTPETTSMEGYIWVPTKPALGYYPIGIGSLSIGLGNKANEEGSLSLGKSNIADGCYSIVGGKNNVVGCSSLSLGEENFVSSSRSCAAGYKNTIVRDNSFASGELNIASGLNSLAIGYNNETNGNASFAQGGSTKANGEYSHSEGEGTQALNKGSHAEGCGTITNASYQHVEGKYNFQNAAFCHIIGGGSSNNSRKNLFAVSNTGDVAVKGNVYVVANNNSNGGEILATREFVTSRIPDFPAADGTYMLTCTVNGGEPTYSWTSV